MATTTEEALAALAAGSPVCVIGRGTANIVHRHEVVHHVTKTQIVVQSKRSQNFTRYHREDGRSMPYSPYGGTSVHPTCQRKAKP